MVLCDGERAHPARDREGLQEGLRRRPRPEHGRDGRAQPVGLLDASTARDDPRPTSSTRRSRAWPTRDARSAASSTSASCSRTGMKPVRPRVQRRLRRPRDAGGPHPARGRPPAVPPRRRRAGSSTRTPSRSGSKEAGAAVVLSAEGYPGPFERGKADRGSRTPTADGGRLRLPRGDGEVRRRGRLVTAGRPGPRRLRPAARGLSRGPRRSRRTRRARSASTGPTSAATWGRRRWRSSASAPALC